MAFILVSHLFIATDISSAMAAERLLKIFLMTDDEKEEYKDKKKGAVGKNKWMTNVHFSYAKAVVGKRTKEIFNGYGGGGNTTNTDFHSELAMTREILDDPVSIVCEPNQKPFIVKLSLVVICVSMADGNTLSNP